VNPAVIGIRRIWSHRARPRRRWIWPFDDPRPGSRPCGRALPRRAHPNWPTSAHSNWRNLGRQHSSSEIDQRRRLASTRQQGGDDLANLFVEHIVCL